MPWGATMRCVVLTSGQAIIQECSIWPTVSAHYFPPSPCMTPWFAARKQLAVVCRQAWDIQHGGLHLGRSQQRCINQGRPRCARRQMWLLWRQAASIKPRPICCVQIAGWNCSALLEIAFAVCASEFCTYAVCFPAFYWATNGLMHDSLQDVYVFCCYWIFLYKCQVTSSCAIWHTDILVYDSVYFAEPCFIRLYLILLDVSLPVTSWMIGLPTGHAWFYKKCRCFCVLQGSCQQ